MSEFTTTTEGLVEFKAKLQKVKAGLRPNTGKELYRDMLVVMGESQEIVPYDEGDLHDSGEVDRPKITASGVHVGLHYGNPTTVNYALKQHEDEELHHPNGKQAKFLQKPFYGWSKNGPRRVARAAVQKSIKEA